MSTVRLFASVVAGLVLCFALSVRGSDAIPLPKGPPLSAGGLLSGFARENGLAPALSGPPGGPSDAVPPAASAGAPAVLGAAFDVKVNQDFSLRPQNETTIAVNPRSPNMLVAGANDYRLGAPVGAAFYTSFDGGFSWDDGIPPYPLFVAGEQGHERFQEVPSGTGDPVVAFGTSRTSPYGPPAGSSVVYYAYLGVSGGFCEHGIFVSRSTNGLLWTRPVVPNLQPPKGLFTPVYWDRPKDCNVFNDKPWLAVDTSGGPHNGRVYVTWSRFQFSHQRYRESPILMAFSDDNAETWSAPVEVSGNSRGLCRSQVSGRRGRCDESQFSNAVVGKDGTLYVAFLNQQFKGAEDGFRNQYLVTAVNPDTMAVSGPYKAAGLIDGQNDFPVGGAGGVTLCNSNFRLNSAGNLALDPADPSGKTLYLVFADDRNGSSFANRPQVSQQPPDSFACPGGLVTDDDDQWFPFAAVAPDGRVDVMFYDRRDDPFNRLAGVYLARSYDGGATWTEVKVSSALSNMNWAFDGGQFMGDYNGLAIGPDGTSFPFWTDARNGTSRIRQSDVYMGSVPP